MGTALSVQPDIAGECYDCSGLTGVRRRMICEGSANDVSPLSRAKYLARWEADGTIHKMDCAEAASLSTIHADQLRQFGDSRQLSTVSFVPHRERVGTALKARIEGLLAIKAGEGCGCSTLAHNMDMWGIAGCERKREEIVGHLVANRPILVAAIKAQSQQSDGVLRQAAGWLGANVAAIIPDAVLREAANWLLSLAIEDARQAAAKLPEPRRPSVVVMPARGADSMAGVFRYSGARARFISSKQLQEDTLKLLSKLPHDITAIAGVARSGLSVATMLAMYLHLPMITIRQTRNDIVDTGNGWRLGGSTHVDPKRGRVLVVDDTVMTGNSIRSIRPIVQKECGEHLFATVYCNPTALVKPDIFAVELPWPHILEWNVFNSILSPSVAMDFDGILCRDCPAGSDDDGTRYLDFIRHAAPLYMPRRSPVPLIVTARIERYRKETEDWLRRHGVRWEKLVMHPAHTLAERNRDDIAAYKAKHFTAWAKNAFSRLKPLIFMESDDTQARRIAEMSKGLGKIVVCPTTGKVY